MNRSSRWVSPLDVQRAYSRTVTALGPIVVPPDLERYDRIQGIVRSGFDLKLSMTPSPSSMRWDRPTEALGPQLWTYELDDLLTQFARDNAAQKTVADSWRKALNEAAVDPLPGTAMGAQP